VQSQDSWKMGFNCQDFIFNYNRINSFYVIKWGRISLYICSLEDGAMFEIPDGLRVGLAKLTGRLSEEEAEVYDAIKGLENRLNYPASLEVLRLYRARELPGVYGKYSDCPDSRYKPYFNRRIHELRERYDERIREFTPRQSVVGNL